MPLEVAFFYADFGFAGYRDLAKTYISSLKKVAPDAVITQLSDKNAQQLDGVDNVGRYNIQCEPDNIMAVRTAMYSKHVRHAKGPLVYTDLDCMWLKRPSFDGCDWDIGVVYRAGQPAMPYNCGMIYTKPNERAVDFWGEWAFLHGSLPRCLHGWWGDQISLALLLGLDAKPGDTLTCHGARIGILDAYDHAFIPTDVNQDVNAVLIHFKGPTRKELMSDAERN